MNNLRELKEQLLDIRKNDWIIPSEVNVHELALKLINNIGTTDSELRDDLILVMLWKLIIEKKLSKEQVRELLDISLSSHHLFYKLGEKKDDSVFNRTFTILVIRWIIYYHNKFGEDLLSKEEMRKVYEDVMRYVRLEKDLRGYVEGKGWGHAMGHAGDALRTLALCNYIKHDALLNILGVVKEKVSISYYVYVNEESERLVSVVMNVLSRKLLEDKEIVDWIRSFEDIKQPSDYPAMHYWKENVKGFLRSLYFRIKFKNGPTIILNEIEKVLHNLNKFFNDLEE